MRRNRQVTAGPKVLGQVSLNCAKTLSFHWCPGPDSNRHDRLRSGDFKSSSSAIWHIVTQRPTMKTGPYVVLG